MARLLSNLFGPVEAVRWDTAIDRMDWYPGEHVTLVGPTGRGKTELLIRLLAERRYGVFLGTKKKDATQDELERTGYRVIRDPAELHSDVAQKFLFRPPFPQGAEASALKAAHGRAFSSMLIRLRDQTGWTIGVDETRYLTEFLRLGDELTLLWLQGRSEGTSVIANTQRPRHIPLEAYSQATHLFFWSSPDLSDVNRIGEMVSLPVAEVRAILQAQEKHEVLYVNTVTSEMFQTNTRW